MSSVVIRKASPADAPGITAVMRVIAAERVYSAIDQPWSVAEQARYMESLPARCALHVAVAESGIVGFQVLDLWSTLPPMSHAGQVGTFLLPDWRGRGLGRKLWGATQGFAVASGYKKLVIQVRASNTGALGFYRGLGFQECGRLTAQVVIDGIADDEILLELFLRGTTQTS